MNSGNSHTTVIGICCIGVALWILFGLLHVIDADTNVLLNTLWPVIFMFIGLLVFIPEESTRGLGFGMFGFGFIIFLGRSGALTGDAGNVITVTLLSLLGILLVVWGSGVLLSRGDRDR